MATTTVIIGVGVVGVSCIYYYSRSNGSSNSSSNSNNVIAPLPPNVSIHPATPTPTGNPIFAIFYPSAEVITALVSLLRGWR